MKTTQFLQIIILLFATSTLAQIKEIGLPSIINYRKTEYKSGTQNWDIDQDINGNLYFANNNGLLQFDGFSWKEFKIPNSTSVRSVKVDEITGRIFVGGYNQFGYFESNSKGKLLYTSLSNLIVDLRMDLTDFIWKIHIYEDEIIFQSFQKVYIFKNNQISHIDAPNRFQFSFSVNNELYFQDIILGILQYRNGKLVPLKGTNVLNNTEIWGMFSLPNKKMLIATLEKGLFIYKNDKVTPWETEANIFIEKNGSLGGSSLKNNLVVLNSVLNGIIICDLNGKIIQNINLHRGLQNNTILSSFVDNKNDLWLGLDNGISYVNTNSPFTFFDSSYNLSTVYGSVIHKGVLYAATNQGVFYHELNSSFIDDNFKLVEGTTAQSWNIQVVGDELICANNNGALIIKDKRVFKNLNNQGYFGFKEVPSRPNYLIGAHYGGFGLFKKTPMGLEFIDTIDGYDKSSNFFEIDDAYLWLLRDGILYQMELSENLRSFVSLKKHSKLKPSNNAINTLQKINGKVYFESYNHLYTYSHDQREFIEDFSLSSLFENCPPLSSITQDAFGNIWYVYGESLGVFMKDKDDNYINSQTILSNLTGYLVNNYLSINTVDKNNVFIGSINGLVHFDTELENSSEAKPKIFIRNFIFNNDTIIQGNSEEKQQLYEMSYAANNIKFTFSTPEYENAQNVYFSYQLEPFDGKWSNWSQAALKEYTNLREGFYKMKVKAKNSYGKESDIHLLEFKIYPPWYRSHMAYLSYLLLFGLTIYLITILVKSRYRKREYYKTVEQRKIYLEKESKIRKEQYLLEKEIEKLNRNKLQTKILAKDKELVNNSLQVVKKNETLNSIIQKLKKIEVNSLDSATKAQFNNLKKSIIKEIKTDNSWKNLEKHIKNVHFEFLKRLKEKYPTISPRELDLATYLLLNMSTKEIAEVMNISNKGVELARYRLRKKLKLKRKQNLTGFLMNI
ncbi:triple tyrosine motif-containing protein [Gelidibacter japonicus]|jgi:DNA-binding CsgD family transcriptional regulator/ligand-binding sensor domain-containing protein|uniref:triple tyrosine motif-containing protein n=1 Tax=Gelidibacter japonicus TaxID=1962232 RepID=UPI002AFE9537|nr:triple tyrosine motif-containing protein [Gelidibacter japonicus]